MLTQQQLMRELHYDAHTGVFTNLRNRPGRGGGIGSVAGHVRPEGYREMKVLGTRYYAHRLAWLYEYGEFPINEIDHINGDRDDNRIDNLRDVTHAINLANRYDRRYKQLNLFEDR